MCRSIAEGGRRCPCDGSAARLRRYHNQRLRTIHADEDLGTPREVPEPPVLSATEVAEQGVAAAWAALKANEEEIEKIKTGWNEHKGLMTNEEIAADMERILELQKNMTILLTNLGASIRSLAVAKYDLPAPQTIEDEMQLAEEAQIEYHREFNTLRRDYFTALRERDKAEEVAKGKDSSEKEKEVARRQVERAQEAADQAQEKMSALPFPDVPKDKVFKGYIEQRREAYIKTLGDFGVAFWNPEADGELDTTRTTAKVKKLINETLTLVPKTWVEASNERAQKQGVPLRVWESKRRAHYVDDKQVRRREMMTSCYIARVNLDPEPGTRAYYEYSKELPPGINPDEAATLGPDQRYYTPLIWYSEFNHNFNSKLGRPAGSGWTEAEVNGEKTWYKYRKEVSATSYEHLAEITIPPVWTEDESRSTLIHEFSHRAEVSLRSVGTAGNGFLDHRTEGEEMTHLGYGYGAKEFTKKDNFSVPYMGKVYAGPHTEIISMGLESLWYGSSGGFVGDSNDPEYESQLLGILAYTGKE